MAVVEQVFPSLTWRIRKLAMYPDKEIKEMELTNDFDGIHFGLYQDDHLTGVVSLFLDKSKAQFRKMAVLPEAQGKGFGKQLLYYLIDFCKLQKVTKLWCNARVNAKEFYVKFGFHETANTYTADGIAYVQMELEIK